MAQTQSVNSSWDGLTEQVATQITLDNVYDTATQQRGQKVDNHVDISTQEWTNNSAIIPLPEATNRTIDNIDSLLKKINRGEVVYNVVHSFDLDKKQKKFIGMCMSSLPECFFAFSARSDFDGIMFAPLILYPDVFPAHPYYSEINIASMVGIVQGFLNFDKTPFLPQEPATIIQAIKIVLGGADLMSWKEKFELSEEEKKPKLALLSSIGDEKWWYARYLDFALDAGIISEQDYSMPDEAITGEHLRTIITNTQSFLNSQEPTKK